MNEMAEDPEGNEDDDEDHDPADVDLLNRFFRIEEVLNGQDVKELATALHSIRTRLETLMAWQNPNAGLATLIEEEKQIRSNHYIPRLLRCLLLSGFNASIAARLLTEIQDDPKAIWILTFLTSTLAISSIDLAQFTYRTERQLKKMSDDEKKRDSNTKK